MKYRCIVADPPWQYLKGVNNGRPKIGMCEMREEIMASDLHDVRPIARQRGRRYAEDNYATMTMEEIASLPVREMVANDAHLYLWVTCPRLYHDRNEHGGLTPYDIMRAWGFEYRTILTWIKSENGAGMGAYFRIDTEHVLFGVRGDCPVAPASRPSNIFRGKRRAHSQKPDGFLDIVERVSPGPYLELFARRQRLGWDAWGNEVYCPPHLSTLTAARSIL